MSFIDVSARDTNKYQARYIGEIEMIDDPQIPQGRVNLRVVAFDSFDVRLMLTQRLFLLSWRLRIVPFITMLRGSFGIKGINLHIMWCCLASAIIYSKI